MAEEKEGLFMQLVLMFQTAAMQQMGKVINPLTKKIEKDLAQAKFSIESNQLGLKIRIQEDPFP